MIWAHSERYWAVWQTGQQHFQRALNHKKTIKSLKPEFCPSNAHNFVQKAPVFYKNEPVWRIVKTAYSLFWIDVLKIYIIYVLKIDIILHYFIWNLDINVEIIGAMFFYLS